MTDTATVETLTAEVRCLMVGSRQVTLSVARQLDVIPLADLRVFGRVHLNNGATCVIGAAPDGSLAVASYYATTAAPRMLEIRLGDLSGKIIVCARRTGSMNRLHWKGVQFEIERNATRSCGHEDHRYGDDGDCHWQPNGMAEEIDLLVTEHMARERRRTQLVKAAMAAPLIVLAGLR